MVYIPSSSVLVSLVKACHTKTELSEIVKHFTEVSLMDKVYRAIQCSHTKTRSDLDIKCGRRPSSGNLDLEL